MPNEIPQTTTKISNVSNTTEQKEGAPNPEDIPKHARLDTANLNPYETFVEWYQEALKTEKTYPNAMTVCTVSEAGVPSARIMLMKNYNEDGIDFYTNINSEKGIELEQNPNICLLFYWKTQGRQIRITGKVSHVSSEKADKYFASRPRDSQISACASKQSSVVLNWATIIDAKEEKKKEFKDNDVIPRPENWIGYHVTPQKYEFWQEGEARTHDRVIWEAPELKRNKDKKEGEWDWITPSGGETKRLFP